MLSTAEEKSHNRQINNFMTAPQQGSQYSTFLQVFSDHLASLLSIETFSILFQTADGPTSLSHSQVTISSPNSHRKEQSSERSPSTHFLSIHSSSPGLHPCSSFYYNRMAICSHLSRSHSCLASMETNSTDSPFSLWD